MRLELRHDRLDRLAAQRVGREPGVDAEALEEGAGAIDGRIDALRFVTLFDAPHPGCVLQQLVALVFALHLEQRGQHDGQRAGVVDAVLGGELVTDQVGGPVLRHAGPDEAIEGLGGDPHQVGAHIVVLRRGQRPGADLEEGLQQALGVAVLHHAALRIGEVLLDDVHEGIGHAVGDLARRQGEGEGRVEHRELRVEQRAHEGELGLGGLAGHHRGAVHLRAGGRQGQHRAERQCLLDHAAATRRDLPGLTLEARRGSNELGAVDDRTAAHGEQEVELLAAHLGDRFHQRLVAGIGFDAGKLMRHAAAERGPHLREGAVLVGTGTAVEHQHPRRWRHQMGELGQGIGTEDDSGGVVKLEIQHVFLSMNRPVV